MVCDRAFKKVYTAIDIFSIIGWLLFEVRSDLYKNNQVKQHNKLFLSFAKLFSLKCAVGTFEMRNLSYFSMFLFEKTFKFLNCDINFRKYLLYYKKFSRRALSCEIYDILFYKTDFSLFASTKIINLIMLWKVLHSEDWSDKFINLIVTPNKEIRLLNLVFSYIFLHYKLNWTTQIIKSCIFLYFWHLGNHQHIWSILNVIYNLIPKNNWKALEKLSLSGYFIDITWSWRCITL